MKKVFISQPMNGLTDEQILNERENIKEYLKKKLGKDIEFIDSFIQDYPENIYDNQAVWYLGKSIEFLSQADLVYFARGWRDARGCRIEYEIAKEYHIPMRVEDELFCFEIECNHPKTKYMIYHEFCNEFEAEGIKNTLIERTKEVLGLSDEDISIYYSPVRIGSLKINPFKENIGL